VVCTGGGADNVTVDAPTTCRPATSWTIRSSAAEAWYGRMGARISAPGSAKMGL
jgi:hypothetical protein